MERKDVTKNKQVIYINMDDSGRLVDEKNEYAFVYGGVYFLSLKEQSKFVAIYKQIVNQIKPKYCNYFNNNEKINSNYCSTHNSKNCVSNCPELKSSNLEIKDRIRLLKLIKRQYASVAIVNNSKVKDEILHDRASKGRFKDYVIKREVKNIVMDLISHKQLNPDEKVVLVLNLDEQSTVSNGYYDLKSSIKEELQYGISNYNYSITFMPILKDVEVITKYRDSSSFFPVQAADLLVGEVRHAYYEYITKNDFDKYQNRISFVKDILYLP